MTIEQKEAEESGRRARRAALELDACPYTDEADDERRDFAPDLARAWRHGWKCELYLQFLAAVGGKRA